MLPKIPVPTGKIKVFFEFGFSSKLADIDNPQKLFLDIIQKKYGINDKDVYELHSYKKITPVGHEYVSFSIEPLI